MIFRGFLFRVLLKKDPAPVAIAISSITFGIGHIINLFTGQASIETVIQILFAVAWGLIMTFVFYKSGCLWICIVAHSLVDVLSKFADSEGNYIYVYMIVTIVTTVVYCIYLSKKPTALK